MRLKGDTGALGIGTIIDIIPYDTLNSGTLSWEGSAGQLFSITNNLTTGSIFSVNDVSGIPSIDVDANGTVSVVSYGGSLGIGTTNPTRTLHIQGDARLTGGLYDVNNVVGAAGSVLTSTGAGVSWTSGGSSSITAETASSNIFFPIFSDVASGTPTATYAADDKLEFRPSTGTLFATVFTSLSDQTQKENIRPIENALELVKQIDGVRYDWIDRHNESSIGVIAQEIEKVLPEVVTTNAKGLKTVSYGNIVAVLIEAIKEQQIRIEKLEEQINA